MLFEKILRPKSEAEAVVDAAESLMLSIQIALQHAMRSRGISQKELAGRLGVSPARVSQILANQDANLTVKTLGRIAHAIGEEFELIPKREALAISKKKEPVLEVLAATCRQNQWQDKTANLDKFPSRYAA